MREYVLSTAERFAAVRPAYVLAALIVAQWAMTAAIGLTATHNGWLFYHGGDGTFYWTTAWSLAHHHLPQTGISYGLPVVFWPLGLVFGANILAGLPAVVLLQLLVLTPLGVLAMYGLATRIGGRLFGYLAAAVWIVAPAVALWFFDVGGYSSSRPKIHDLVLPNALGLTNLADYASMILALVATYLLVRALDERHWNDVLLAGLTTGALIAVKPSNGYYAIAPALAFVACRRWREGLLFAAMIAPVLLTLAIWKKIGLGYIPIASPQGAAVAYGDTVASISGDVHRYVRFDWDTFTENMAELREESRNIWLLGLLTIGGLAGLIRRAPIPGIAIGSWFLSYFLFKGNAGGLSSVHATSFFRFVMPAYPAFVLIVCSVVFLLPGLGRRRRVAAVAPSPPTRVALVVALVVLAYPLAFVSTARAWGPGHVVSVSATNVQVPVSNDLATTLRIAPDGIGLSWKGIGAHGRARYSYRILRAGSIGCAEKTQGARDCELDPSATANTRETHYVDHSPPEGTLIYRIALVAGWEGDEEGADLLMVGPPMPVVVRGPGAGSG